MTFSIVQIYLCFYDDRPDKKRDKKRHLALGILSDFGLDI